MIEQEIQTQMVIEESDVLVRNRKTINEVEILEQNQDPATPQQVENENNETVCDKSDYTRYPQRVRKKPSYFNEYITDENINDQVLTNIDYC